MTLEVIPADLFTIQELTDLYNQTRVDYLVPMPMNVERLREYVRDFDVNLHHSCVALDNDGEILGLGMLGVRGQTAWVTRLGVLPSSRRTGAGLELMDCLVKNADALGMKETHLEVIKNNEPAYQLFTKMGFVETETYLVMRHAPRPLVASLGGDVRWLNFDEALEKLETYPKHLTWITAFESMSNSPNTEGLYIKLPNGSSGWMVYRNTKFTLRSTLSHLILHTEQGDPQAVATQLLSHLHTKFPYHDTYAENICEDDPHLPALHELGYFTNFSRIEMRRQRQSLTDSQPDIEEL